MESVESPLEVLTRAASMVQHSRVYSGSDDADTTEAPTRAPSSSESTAAPGTPEGAAPPKQLPSAKWRRDRRSTTRIPDYKNREPGVTGSKASRSQSFNDKSLSSLPLGALRLRQEGLHHSEGDLAQDSAHVDGGLARGTVSFASLKATPAPSGPADVTECPLDMSVKTPARICPATLPPTYSQAISSGFLYRPSVITQAPTNGAPLSPTPTKDAGKGEYVPGSMSMCDPVIDEHFRRSLGANYMSLFNKNKGTNNGVTNGKSQKISTKDRGSSPIMFASDPCTKFLNTNSKSPEGEDSSRSETPDEVEMNMDIDDTAGLSVDDHFAKALGDTWKKLQEKNPKIDILKSKQSPEGVTKSNASSVVKNIKDLPNPNHDNKIIRGIVI